MKVEVLNKLRVAVGILLTILIQPSLHSETVRVGPNGKLITDSEDKVGIGSDGKLQNRYSKGSDSLYKSNIDESIFSYGNDLLKKCGDVLTVLTHWSACFWLRHLGRMVSMYSPTEQLPFWPFAPWLNLPKR